MPTNPPDKPLDLTGTWQLDAEPGEDVPEDQSPAPEPSLTVVPPLPSTQIIPPPSEDPPSLEQIFEAMLFVGGHSLTAQTACAAVRGLTPDRFHSTIEMLTRLYRKQHRAYTIEARDGGFVLTVLPVHRPLREKLFGGPREARLDQPAVDVLSVVAYRQPVDKAEVDAIRGTDSSGLLRQLVRLGLVVVQHRAEAGTRAVRYGTTKRFLEIVGIESLDELPRLGDTSQL
jgi:segregation and condensation protein B